MSDNTNQQRADQFDFPEPDTFVIVKNCVTKSQIAQDPNVPGLSEEQLKELPEALQAAVKTGKFADLKAVMMAMTREERSKLYDFIDAVDCKVISGFSVSALPTDIEALAMQALHEQLDADHGERSQLHIKQMRGLERSKDRLVAKAKSLEDTRLDITGKLNVFMAKNIGDLGKLLATLDTTKMKMEDLSKLGQDMIKRRDGYDDLERYRLEMKLAGLEHQLEVLYKDIGKFEKRKEDLIKEMAELDSEREYLGLVKEQVTKAHENIRREERERNNSSSSSSDCKKI